MIFIYSIPGCKNCSEIKELLDSNSIVYTEINMKTPKEYRDIKRRFKEMGFKHYPVIEFRENSESIFIEYSSDKKDLILEKCII